MTRRHITPLIVTGALFWAASAHAGPSPEAMPLQVTGDALGAETSIPAPPQAKPKLSLSGVFQPAPMPDPDFDRPNGGGGAAGPSITPALFSHKAEFAGDGFAAASDADHGLDHRRAPAAGLNWSVPVK